MILHKLLDKFDVFLTLSLYYCTNYINHLNKIDFCKMKQDI